MACFQAAVFADIDVRTTNCGGSAGWSANSTVPTAMVDGPIVHAGGIVDEPKPPRESSWPFGRDCHRGLGTVVNAILHESVAHFSLRAATPEAMASFVVHPGRSAGESRVGDTTPTCSQDGIDGVRSVIADIGQWIAEARLAKIIRRRRVRGQHACTG